MSDFLITNLELADSYKASGKERHAFAILSSTEWISGPIPVFFFFFPSNKNKHTLVVLQTSWNIGALIFWAFNTSKQWPWQ